MKTCEETEATLVDLVFGEMEPETEMRVNHHLATCATCREQERRLLDLRGAVKGPERRPAEALRTRIRASLPERRTARRFAFLWHPVPASAAVAVCLVGALIFIALPRDNRPAARPDNTARSRRVTVDAVAPPFVPAEPFDTGLLMAAPRESLADSANPGPPAGGDSL
jgi:anti-sigma factor RsiW